MISIALATGLISLCIAWLITVLWKKNHNLPPGPWGLPLLGYYPFLSHKHFLDYARLAERYGSIFSFRTTGGKLIVVLNGTETIKEVLVKRSEEFIGRPKEFNLAMWISNGLGISQEEGSIWKEHRRFFLQSAKSFGFGKQESEKLLHEEIETLIKDLKNEKKGPVNVRFHVTYAANSVVCPLLFSKKFVKDDSFEDVANNAAYLVEMFADRRYQLIGFIYEYIVMKFLPSTQKMRKAKEHFIKLAKEIVDEHVNEFDPDNPRDYIDSYLQEAYELDKAGVVHTFTMKRLIYITLNMLMEGTESVGGTISELLDEASRHPDEQKLVQEELDSVVGRERQPKWIDRQKLPYLEAFIQELYRHNMPFNISTHYCNYKDTTIHGYQIPQRTIIVANQWTVNNDPVMYPDPSKFNPKRFIGEDGKKIKTEGPYPFGIGKRSCVGESLAQIEVFLIIAAILQNFTLYPAEQSGFLNVVSRS